MTADADLARAAAVFFNDGEGVVELRVLGTRYATMSGYFDDPAAFVREAQRCDAIQGANLYALLNPALPALLARAVNRVKPYVRVTSTDDQVVRRRWVPIDVDPRRPSGIPSTDAEHQAAIERTEEGARWLAAQGVPVDALVMMDSGNGGLLCVRVDLPNDAAGLALVRRIIEAVAFRLDDDVMKVDTAVTNAARIVRLAGSMNRKGDGTPDRPHRRSRLLHVPDALVVCPVDVLVRIAALAPEQPKRESIDRGSFDIDTFIQRHLPDARGPFAWNGGRKWVLPICPWNAEHDNRAAYVVQLSGGAIAAGCHHDGCSGRDWHALRDRFEPRTQRSQSPPDAEGRDNGDGVDDRDDADDVLLAELARLSPIEYDRRREAAARQLGLRIATLDGEVARCRGESNDTVPGGACLLRSWEVEPWPEQVATGNLLDDLVAMYQRHIVLPAHGAKVLALWVLHTWAHGAATISPLLVFASPEKRCGKTTALLALRYTTPRPLSAVNVTAAVLFRAVDRWQPTLLLDEADTYLDGADGLRGIINSGHVRAMAQTIRCVGDDHEPRTYATWAPKALALIQHGRGLHETLRDRAITLPMRRRLASEHVDRLRGDRDTAYRDLRRRAARWASDAVEALRCADPVLPDGLGDRAADNWRPLLAIADLAGGEWPERARAVATALSGEEGDTNSVRVLLLGDLADMLEKAGGRIASQTLTDRLAGMEERPWPEWHRGRPITPRQVANLLRPLGISPCTIRLADGTAKGYLLKDAALDDALRRYLPSRSVTASQTAPDAAEGDSAIRNSSAVVTDGVTDREARKHAPVAACDGVTDAKGGHPETCECATCLLPYTELEL